jgi:thiol:disulfide interchange protein DsbD
MKKVFLSLILVMVAAMAMSQVINPVKWTYTAKKIADKTYEVHLTAMIDQGWHVYTLDHKGDIGVATSVKFGNNPLATANGTLQAKGKPVSMKDPSSGEMVKFYTNNVDIVQVYKLKANVKTNITGTLEYMTCDDERCLPPSTKTFSVSLQ